MIVVWIVGALAAVLAAGALRFARRIRARHRRFLSAPVPAASPDAMHIVDHSRALYHGTRFADGVAVLAPAWKEPSVCDLFCTAEALFLQREGQGALLVIGFAEVAEAALHRAFAPIAGKDLPMLRLRWRRGGELLETGLSLRGGMAELETLRREIHLRQENVEEQLAPLLNRTPP